MKLKLLAIVLLLVVGGAAVFVALGGLPRNANAGTSYLTGTAAVTDVSDDVAATGSIASATTWSYTFGSTPTTRAESTTATQDGTWTATAVNAKVGDIVKKGEVLATASNTTLAADLDAARNDWTSAQLQRLQAQDAYDAATTTAGLRQTRSSLLNAQNAATAAHAKYTDLKKAASLNRLVASAAGVVTAVNITPGSDVPSGAAITVASTDYVVTAEVVETDVSSMKLEQAASVTVSAIGADLDGKVTAIAPTATTGSSGSSSSVVSYAVTVALTNPPATLRAGMTADVTITTASAANVLAVPAAALRGSADNYTVLVTCDGYRDAGFFPVKVSPDAPSRVDLMLVPKRARYRFPSWDELKADHQRFADFLNCERDVGTARTRYDELRQSREPALASLLNLTAAMSGIHLPVGTPLDYFRQIEWEASLAQDRFFGFADAGIVNQVKTAWKQGEFEPEASPGMFHGGATSSYKQTQFGGQRPVHFPRKHSEDHRRHQVHPCRTGHRLLSGSRRPCPPRSDSQHSVTWTDGSAGRLCSPLDRRQTRGGSGV